MGKSIFAERFFCLTDVGRRRSENQDAWSADSAAGLFLVADGMGGMKAGGAAAKAVAEGLPGALSRRLDGLPRRTSRGVQACLRETIAEFSAALRERAKEDPRLRGMGSTVVLALVRGTQAHVANLGDSRAYLLEAGRLRRLTRDHSIVAVMLELGQITPEEARVHPMRHSISRYAGMDGDASPDVAAISLKKSARLLLCTDGLTNMVADAGLEAALSQEGAPEAACRRLLEEANAAGGLDNVTAMIVDIRRGR